MVLKFEPWGDDPLFEWDEYNLKKMWNHRIRDFEVQECFFNEHDTKPHPKAKSCPENYKDRFLVQGVTNGGRKLLIVVEHKGGNIIRPITGWQE